MVRLTRYSGGPETYMPFTQTLVSWFRCRPRIVMASPSSADWVGSIPWTRGNGWSSFQPDATRARTQPKLKRVSSLLHGPTETSNCCAPSSRRSGTPLNVTVWFGRPGSSTSSASTLTSDSWELCSAHRTSAVGDRPPTTENTSGACEPSSDVLLRTVAASINAEQSSPVHPPSHKHIDVGRHVPFEVQSLGHEARSDGAGVAAVGSAVGPFTAAWGLTVAKPLVSQICVGSAVGPTVGLTVGSTVPDSTSCRGDALVGSSLGSGVGSMVCVGSRVVGSSVSVGKALGVTVATDGSGVVGICEGVPVVGASEGRAVVGAALVGSTLGLGVVGSALGAGVVGGALGVGVGGADEGAIVDGALLGRDDGSQEGPGDGGMEGIVVGSSVGNSEGAIEGSEEGQLVGSKVGLREGAHVGSSDGSRDGASVDLRVGLLLGTRVGNALLRCVGRTDGRNVGSPVRPTASGTLDGAIVGLSDLTITETTETRLTSFVGLDPLAPVEGAAGATLAKEAVLATGAPIVAWAELLPAAVPQLNVSLPLETSAAMLSAKAAAGIPSSADRTRMSTVTLAALTSCIWNRSAGTL